MPNKVSYEWFVEEMEGDEIVEVHHWDTRTEAENYAALLILGGSSVEISLVRQEYTLEDGEIERSYAYLVEGKLPTTFENGVNIPKRFLED